MPQPTSHRADLGCVALGRDLFFDPGLSRDGRVSCATCHLPQRSFSDGRRVPLGVLGRPGNANAPALVNVAFRPNLFWDGRAFTLEEQVSHALLGWAELDSTRQALEHRLGDHPRYRGRLAAMTGAGESSFEVAARCLASFERTIVAADSPFDRYLYGGETLALSEPARQGLALFTGKARCGRCHTISPRFALFSDGRFHNTGVGYHPRFDYLGYSGNGLEGNPATRNTFRGAYATPSLRNVAETAPYMHDGSLSTLADVVDHYDRGGAANPFLDAELRPLGLSPADKRALVAFLETLTGQVWSLHAELPPS